MTREAGIALSAAVVMMSCGGVYATEFANLRATVAPSHGSVKLSRKKLMTGADADAAMIQMQPVATTIARLAKLTRPKSLDNADIKTRIYYADHRIAPAETTIWKVDLAITSVQVMGDGDYRLILSDATGSTLVCELPDSEELQSKNRLAPKIARVRATVERRLHPRKEATAVNVPCTVSGVGYFGRQHSQKNAMPNGIEFRPVVSINFK